MKNKKTLCFLLILVALILVGILSFKSGEKSAFNKIPEIGLEGSIKFDTAAQEKIIDDVNKQIKKNSVIGEKYYISVKKMTGNWIIFDVNPLDPSLDVAQVYVEYEDEQTKVYGPGTSFEFLELSNPELFN